MSSWITGLRGRGALVVLALSTTMLTAAPGYAQDNNGSRQRTPDVAEQGAANAAEAVAGAPQVAVSIPSIDAQNSSLDEAALRDILAGNIGQYTEQLATLDADSISIPEISIKITAKAPDEDKPVSQTMVYRDLKLTAVKDGLAQSVEVGSAEVTSDVGTDFTFGPMGAKNFNIAALLAFYGATSGDAAAPLQTLYTDFRLDGGKLTTPNAQCDFGAVTNAEFKARPIGTSIFDVVALAQSMQGSTPENPPPPEQIAKVVNFYAELFQAFETAPTQFAGFTCDAKDSDGKPVKVALGGMTVGAFTGGRYPDITVTGFDMTGADNAKVSLESGTFKGFSITPLLEVLQGANGQFSDSWGAEHGRELIPPFEGFAIKGLSIDVPEPTAPDARIVANIGNVDLSLSDWHNGIPAQVDSTADGIQFTVPPESNPMAYALLGALGLERFDLDYNLKAKWDEASQSIVLDNISVSGDKIGSVSIAATLGNATADLFGTDTALATAAGMALTLKSVDIGITDMGAAPVLWQMAASMQGQTPEAYKTMLSGMAQGMTLAFLGGTPEAMNVSTAIGKFINGGKALNIDIVAKDEAGLSSADFAALQADPTKLAKVVSVTATAE